VSVYQRPPDTQDAMWPESWMSSIHRGASSAPSTRDSFALLGGRPLRKRFLDVDALSVDLHLRLACDAGVGERVKEILKLVHRDAGLARLLEQDLPDDLALELGCEFSVHLRAGTLEGLAVGVTQLTGCYKVARHRVCVCEETIEEILDRGCGRTDPCWRKREPHSRLPPLPKVLARPGSKPSKLIGLQSDSCDALEDRPLRRLRSALPALEPHPNPLRRELVSALRTTVAPSPFPSASPKATVYITSALRRPYSSRRVALYASTRSGFASRQAREDVAPGLGEHVAQNFRGRPRPGLGGISVPHRSHCFSRMPTRGSPAAVLKKTALVFPPSFDP